MRAVPHLILAAVAACSLCSAALADEPMYYAPGGIALAGYDVVAYFESGQAVPGSPDNALMWRGATWYFASPDHLMTFEMNPLAYAPQFGGYCAYAVAEGQTGTSAPDAFFLRDGKLYFLHSARMLQELQTNLPGIVTEAESHWPEAIGR